MCGGSAFDLLHTPFELGGCRCINILVDRNGVVQEKQRRMVLDSDAFVPALCNRAHLLCRAFVPTCSALARQQYRFFGVPRGELGSTLSRSTSR